MCLAWQSERCGLNRTQRGPSILYRTKSRMPEGEKLSSSEATPELLSRSRRVIGHAQAPLLEEVADSRMMWMDWLRSRAVKPDEPISSSSSAHR